MNVTITSEHRFSRTPDGAVWTVAANSYAFWTRYLSVFSQVRIVARVLDVPHPPAESKRADGPGVTVHAVPYYHGPLQFARRYAAIRAAVRNSVHGSQAVIMRVPSFLAMVLEPILHKRGQPYSLEVVGDPYDVFAPGVLSHPLRPVFRYRLTNSLRTQCCRASAAAYVTRDVLQQRYPCPSSMTGVSDVELSQEAFCARYRSIEGSADRKATLAFVGTFEQLYKGPDILLRAVAVSVSAGFDLKVLLVGDGRYRSLLEDLARRLNIRERCQFLGQLSEGAAVRNVLDSVDLFVLPSRTEGLPRALIEAMARSLPCIGSNVGGIPELLPEEDMVRPGDVEALARKIQDFVSDPQRLARTSRRNVATARQYLDEDLQKLRTAFYARTKASAEHWLEMERAA